MKNSTKMVRAKVKLQGVVSWMGGKTLVFQVFPSQREGRLGSSLKGQGSRSVFLAGTISPTRGKLVLWRRSVNENNHSFGVKSIKIHIVKQQA